MVLQKRVIPTKFDINAMTHMTVIPLIIIIRIITRSKAQTGLEDAGTEFATSVKNIAYDNKIIPPIFKIGQIERQNARYRKRFEQVS
jgi:hypothetical protein